MCAATESTCRGPVRRWIGGWGYHWGGGKGPLTHRRYAGTSENVQKGNLQGKGLEDSGRPLP